jgi:hypothetical protein
MRVIFPTKIISDFEAALSVATSLPDRIDGVSASAMPTKRKALSKIAREATS